MSNPTVELSWDCDNNRDRTAGDVETVTVPGLEANGDDLKEELNGLVLILDHHHVHVELINFKSSSPISHTICIVIFTGYPRTIDITGRESLPNLLLPIAGELVRLQRGQSHMRTMDHWKQLVHVKNMFFSMQIQLPGILKQSLLKLMFGVRAFKLA